MLLEEKWGVTLEVEHRVWPWLVEYAGHLLTRAEVGADGKTAYDRSMGKGGNVDRGGIWRRRVVEEKKRGLTAGEGDVHGGRWDLLGSDREHWRDDCGRRERCVEDEDDSKEA